MRAIEGGYLFGAPHMHRLQENTYITLSILPLPPALGGCMHAVSKPAAGAVQRLLGMRRPGGSGRRRMFSCTGASCFCSSLHAQHPCPRQPMEQTVAWSGSRREGTRRTWDIVPAVASCRPCRHCCPPPPLLQAAPCTRSGVRPAGSIDRHWDAHEAALSCSSRPTSKNVAGVLTRATCKGHRPSQRVQGAMCTQLRG